MSPATVSRTRRRRLLLTTVALLAVGAGLVGDAGAQRRRFTGPADLPSYPAPGVDFGSGTSDTVPDPTPSASEPGLALSVPVALRIPAIGVATVLSAMGLNPDGTVEVPTIFEEAGWYGLGPSPGEAGSAVILGHVDSHEGPAVFFKLRRLRPGDTVEVSMADGMVTRFVVTMVATYPKKRFPAESVYGSHGYSALQLVTCGGTFDRRTRSYQSNVVVYTTLVEVVPA
jgi:sortase (surface protein transpeptidase)